MHTGRALPRFYTTADPLRDIALSCAWHASRVRARTATAFEDKRHQPLAFLCAQKWELLARATHAREHSRCDLHARIRRAFMRVRVYCERVCMCVDLEYRIFTGSTMRV